MNKNYSLILAVISSRHELYDSIINKYWAKFIKYIKKNNYKIKIFLLLDESNINGLDIEEEDVLYFDFNKNATESYTNSKGYLKHILKKTIDCFDYIENNYKYKHMLRTNLSSFFILDELIKVHNSLNSTDVFAGVYGTSNNLTFISGTAFWLSSDNIKFILLNKDNLDFKFMDDLAISILLIDKNKICLDRFDIINDINIDDKYKYLHDIISQNHYHIRIKNERDRSLDMVYMKEFTDILYKNYNFYFKKENIITSDKYLELVKDFFNVSYIKTDFFITNKPIYWRGEIHNMKKNDIWVSGHSDYSITKEIFDKYQDNTNRWYTINKEYIHPKLFSIPLGITNDCDDSSIHRIYGNTDIMIEVANSPKIIINLVYMNFNINTYPKERQYCYNIFYNKSWVTLGNINNTLCGRKFFLEEIHNHKFVLCPRGNGIDTHRLWETLYMDSIPVVKNHISMDEFKDLPILFINDWEEVTEKFLEEQYFVINNKKIKNEYNMKKLDINYWKDLISTA